ncbi:hypothetical protein EV182_002905 [Spiromyces aspiralis]|uniref:Uncharacterized protein n=1 Tax=Spiromyces aspiralis TaxID=68401 RepID=A0ACC1HV97_9FUNG|nr:hypothetical protein EV182_002905 [Spiromyces aspiralis]
MPASRVPEDQSKTPSASVTDHATPTNTGHIDQIPKDADIESLIPKFRCVVHPSFYMALVRAVSINQGRVAIINNRSQGKVWTDEEQRRFEELLIIYPDEPVANHRWRKIADALGTCTYRQVASHAQKYFIKLHKAGLPVPGKVPDTSNWESLKRGNNKRQRFAGSSGANVENNAGQINFRNPAAHIPKRPRSAQSNRRTSGAIYLEQSRTSSPSSSLAASSPSVAPTTNAVAAVPAAKPLPRSAKAMHLGYRCDNCYAEPVVGTRWHCLECHGDQEIDLCNDCMEDGTFANAWHSIRHKFKPYHEAEEQPYYDANGVGTPSVLTEYSYLG